MLSLLGALAGGVLAAWFTSRKEANKVVRDKVDLARSALERLVAAQSGPDLMAYPGMDETFLAQIREERWRVFFEQYFTANFEAKAALGSLRHLDEALATKLDEMTDWRLDLEHLRELRAALSRIEQAHR